MNQPTPPPLPPVKVPKGEPLDPRTRVMYEAGKSMLLESVEAGREWCKHMVTLATGGVPIYLGPLKLFLPDGFRPTLAQGLLVLVPALAFLASAVVAAVGYAPVTKKFSVEIIDEIEEVRGKLIRRRRLLGTIAFALVLLGMIGTILVAAAVVIGSATG